MGECVVFVIGAIVDRFWFFFYYCCCVVVCVVVWIE